MKTNPGGLVQPSDAIGREVLVDQIWTVLESQSVYMNAERRIGKTTLLNILESKPRQRWQPAKKDLEGCHTAWDFANTVYAQIHQFLGTTQKMLRRVKEFVNHIGGTEIGGVIRLPEGNRSEWKTLLQKSFEDLHEAHKEMNCRILFLWDEVPFMVDNIRRRESEQTAMEVLDALRCVRQTYPEIRMVMTGSVGLHHVLTRLKESGYANAPMNDMAPVEVPALAPEKGRELAQLLLEGEKVDCTSIVEVSQELTKLADHFPYYIHHLVRQLKFRNEKANRKVIKQIIEEQLASPNDPWELKHYRNRILTYDGVDESSVLSILDVVAREKTPLTLEQIAQKVSSTAPALKKERLRGILTLLELDHYLRRRKSGYSFTFPLIRQWWRLDRSLG